MTRLTAIVIGVGIVATALSLLFEDQYCMDGPGRGVPAAITHPAHGPMPLEFHYSGNEVEGRVLDAKSLGIDLVVWSVFFGVPIGLLDRKRKRREVAGKVSKVPPA